MDPAIGGLHRKAKTTETHRSIGAKRIAIGEIGLDQAHYELLDDELIPMPQRCAVFARVPLGEEDESRLKEKIRVCSIRLTKSQRSDFWRRILSSASLTLPSATEMKPTMIS